MIVHRIAATVTPGHSWRVVTDEFVIRRKAAANSPAFNSSERTIPAAPTRKLWPSPPITSPDASVATMNSAPSENSSASPRSREWMKFDRLLNGTAHTRSNAFWAA